MNKFLTLLTVLIALVVTGCVSANLPLTPADISQSGCLRSRATDETDLKDTESEDTFDGIPLHEIYRVSATLTLKDRICYVDIKNTFANCGASLQPEIEFEEGKIKITLNEEVDQPMDCYCPFDVSFKCKGLSSGQYSLLVISKPMIEGYIELAEGEPSSVSVYATSFGNILNLTQAEKRWLDEYFASLP